jgi:hypothetical protein
MIFRLLCLGAAMGVALGGASCLPAAADRAPATAAQPKWIIDDTQLDELSAADQQEITTAGVMDLAGPVGGTNAEHYTSVAPCLYLVSTPCDSLTTHPPPAGTWAVYDDEHWSDTPGSEQVHPCRAMDEAAAIIRQAGAMPVLAPPGMQPWKLQCAATAAGNGGYVHLQLQPFEVTKAFVSDLSKDAAVIHAANPNALVSFGISTNPKYKPTATIMCSAYQAAEQAVPGAPAWLNVVPWPGHPGWRKAVRMATAFLACE